jgi:hypothetical protein
VQDDGARAKLLYAYLFIDCEEGLISLQGSEGMITLSVCNEQKTSKSDLYAAILVGNPRLTLYRRSVSVFYKESVRTAL